MKAIAAKGSPPSAATGGGGAGGDSKLSGANKRLQSRLDQQAREIVNLKKKHKGSDPTPTDPNGGSATVESIVAVTKKKAVPKSHDKKTWAIFNAEFPNKGKQGACWHAHVNHAFGGCTKQGCDKYHP